MTCRDYWRDDFPVFHGFVVIRAAKLRKLGKPPEDLDDRVMVRCNADAAWTSPDPGHIHAKQRSDAGVTNKDTCWPVAGSDAGVRITGGCHPHCVRSCEGRAQCSLG